MSLDHECVRHFALPILIVFDAAKFSEVIAAHREVTWIDLGRRGTNC